MQKQITLGIIGLIGLVIVGVVGWYLASPLFIDNVVDEEFPIDLPSPEELAKMPAEELDKIEDEMLQVAADMPDKKMDDPMPEAASNSPTIVVQGQFQDADSFHKGAGQATIYQLLDSNHVLRFENFEATNGPDLHVLLAKHPAPTSRDQIMEGYLDLGSLKGNIGNQNYDIPAGTDISEYRSIVIYCMPFHVIFSTASLS
jgi:hypothetical protein